MSEFINTIDLLGDDAVTDSIIDRSITEFKDNVVTVVGSDAFKGCRQLVTIEVPNVSGAVGSSAFASCTSLVSIELPNVEHLSGSCFSGCSSLCEVHAPLIKTLGAGDFESCTSLTSIELPLLTNTGYNAFNGSGLVEISFPLLKSIGIQVFQNCKSLKRVKLPSLTSTNTNAFGLCQVLELVDFRDLRSTDGNNFIKCYKLKTFIIRNESSVATLNNTLYDTLIPKGTGFIYVPRALIEDYKVATNWSIYATQFRPIDDYTVDGTATGELKTCAGISLSANELIFEEPVSKTLVATIVNGPIIDDDILWSSDDEATVIVSNGTIVSMSEGTTTITATCQDKRASCVVTVLPNCISNILNGVDFTKGYLTNEGVYTSSNSDRSTDAFPVSNYVGETFKVTIQGMSSSATQMKNSRIVYYSESNAAVGYMIGTNGNPVITSVVPEGAAYARVSVNITNGFTGIEIASNDILLGRLQYTA